MYRFGSIVSYKRFALLQTWITTDAKSMPNRYVYLNSGYDTDHHVSYLITLSQKIITLTTSARLSAPTVGKEVWRKFPPQLITAVAMQTY